jgi:acetyltransferase
MSLYNLDKIFRPASIAVVGASETHESIGRAVMTNLIEGGYEGKLFPVNPKHDQVQGRQCHARLADLPETPDLAVIAIPIAGVPDLIDTCVAMGVPGAVILSAGGREAGEAGRALEERIKEKAMAGGLRIVGPNCLGVVCPANRINASFAAHMPPVGNLAFISQSGAVCSAMIDLSLKENLGYRYFISIGSMLDVDFGDLVDYVGNDPEVQSVLLYVESLSQLRKFMSAVRAVSRMKPVVVLKSGRSPQGARAASSHTGAMVGDDRVYDAAFRRAGAVRVHTVGDFFNCAELLAKQPRPRGPRLTILTNSGGPGVMAADAVSEYGLSLSEPGEQTLGRLDEVLPPHWSRSNPVDILGDAGARRYVDALACIDLRETDGLLIILNPQAMTDPAEVAGAVAGAVADLDCPVIASWMGGADVETGNQVLNEAGIATYDTPEQAVEAFRYLYDYGRNLELLQQIPPKVDRRLRFRRDAVAPLMETGLQRENGLLTELAAKTVLEAYSIPVNPTRLAASREEAERLAAEIGFPLAMKVSSSEVVHKSRAGGVRLQLDSRQAVSAAYDQIATKITENVPEARIQGVTLQPMCAPVDVELLLGAKKDPHFGPVLLFGWGGVHAEALEDRGIALAPVNRMLARRLMEETRVFSVLAENSGTTPTDLAALEEILVCLSQLVVDFPEIRELDINPLAVVAGRPVAVDARIVVEAAQAPSPRHLAISPYPQQYEDPHVHTDGLDLCIRPIKPEDSPLLQDLFAQLSPTSIYHRFFAPLKTLPHNMLVRFTQIDYDREIALVAIDRQDGREQMRGVGRIIGGPDGRRGEFAVLVADAWQGKGIGAALLVRVLRIMQARGMARVWGSALGENRQMASLARKLGFSVRRDAGGEFEMTIDLQAVELDAGRAS